MMFDTYDFLADCTRSKNFETPIAINCAEVLCNVKYEIKNFVRQARSIESTVKSNDNVDINKRSRFN